MASTVDFNVKNYSVDELFNLLGLTPSSGRSEIETETRKQIKKFSKALKSNYVNFYIEIREKLLNHIEAKEIKNPPKPKWSPTNYKMDYNGQMWEYPQQWDGAILPQDGNERIAPSRAIQTESGRAVLESAPKAVEQREVLSYVAGVLNPRKVSTYKVLIDIDSRAIADEGDAPRRSCDGEITLSGKDVGSSLEENASNFMFQADTKIAKAISLELLYYDIPYTWHEFTPSYGTDLFRVLWEKVTEANNSFKVKWWNFEKDDSKIEYDAADVSGVIDLPRGNYTLDDFLKEMNDRDTSDDILFEKHTVGVSGENGFIENWKDQSGNDISANKIKISRIKRHGILVETMSAVGEGGAPRSCTISVDISGDGYVDWGAMHDDLSKLKDEKAVGITIDLSGDKLTFKRNVDVSFNFTFDRDDTIKYLGLDISGDTYDVINEYKVSFKENDAGDDAIKHVAKNAPLKATDNFNYYNKEPTKITFSDDDVALSMGFEPGEINLDPSVVGKYTIITDASGFMGNTKYAFDVDDVDQPVIIKEDNDFDSSNPSTLFVYDPSKINIEWDNGLAIKKKIEHKFTIDGSAVDISDISGVNVVYTSQGAEKYMYIKNNDLEDHDFGRVDLQWTANKLKFSSTTTSFNLNFVNQETANIMGFDLNNSSILDGTNNIIESNRTLPDILQFYFNINRGVDFRHVDTANMLGFYRKNNENDGIAESNYISTSNILYIPEYSIEITGGNKKEEELLSEINDKLSATPIKNYLIMDMSGQKIRIKVKNISGVVSDHHNFEITFDSSMNTDILEFDDIHLSGDYSYTAVRDVSSTLIPWEKTTYIGNVRYEEIGIPSGNYNLKRGDENNLIDTLDDVSIEVDIKKNRQGTITISDPSGFPFKMIFYDQNSDDTKCGKSGAKSDYNLGKILGFVENEYDNLSHSYTSEKQCNTRETTKFLYLSINDFNNSRRSITRATHQTIKEKIKLSNSVVAKDCSAGEILWEHRTGRELKASEIYAAEQALASQDTSSQNRYFNATPPEDVFARIPIRGADPTEFPAPSLRYDGGDRFIEKRQYFGPVDIKRLKIEIFNDKGKIIDLQGGSVFLQLRAECLYQL